MKKFNIAENLGKYHLGTLTIEDWFPSYDILSLYLIWILEKDYFCLENILYFWIYWTSAVVEVFYIYLSIPLTELFNVLPFNSTILI